jgi:hypothetical protein
VTYILYEPSRNPERVYTVLDVRLPDVLYALFEVYTEYVFPISPHIPIFTVVDDVYRAGGFRSVGAGTYVYTIHCMGVDVACTRIPDTVQYAECEPIPKPLRVKRVVGKSIPVAFRELSTKIE